MLNFKIILSYFINQKIIIMTESIKGTVLDFLLEEKKMKLVLNCSKTDQEELRSIEITAQYDYVMSNTSFAYKLQKNDKVQVMVKDEKIIFIFNFTHGSGFNTVKPGVKAKFV